MKITLMTIGTHGDVRPYVALGKGLKAAGFEICVATHEEFRGFVTDNGLQFHPVKGNPRDMLASDTGQQLMASGKSVTKFFAEFRNAAEKDMYEGFSDCYEAAKGAEAIIFPFFVAGVGYQIARKLDCKTILGYLQPTLPTNAFPVIMLPHLYLGGFLNKASHKIGEGIFWHFFHDTLARWSQEILSLDSPSRWRPPFKALAKESLVLMGFSKYLVPTPLDWKKKVHLTGFWSLPTGQHYTPPATLERFLEQSPTPIYIGFGSMAEKEAQQLQEDIATVLEHTGQRAVLVSGWSALNSQGISENLYCLESIPHDWLFPRVRMAIHHGGAGTTSTAARAGIPQIIVPFFGDQPFWGQRIFGMGAGPRPIPRTALNADKLEHAVRQVLEHPRYTEHAATLGKRLQQEDGVTNAVQQIQAFLRA